MSCNKNRGVPSGNWFDGDTCDGTGGECVFGGTMNPEAAGVEPRRQSLRVDEDASGSIDRILRQLTAQDAEALEWLTGVDCIEPGIAAAFASRQELWHLKPEVLGTLLGLIGSSGLSDLPSGFVEQALSTCECVGAGSPQEEAALCLGACRGDAALAIARRATSWLTSGRGLDVMLRATYVIGQIAEGDTIADVLRTIAQENRGSCLSAAAWHALSLMRGRSKGARQQG